MSAVAMHFDPTFMGPRPSYTWPETFDSPSPASMLGQDYSLILPPLSESSESPQMSPRTMSSSPPRYINHPDQRGLKRRRDRVRQDSRASTRMNRAGSTNSYMGSPSLSMADTASNMALPVYSTAAPTSMSILAEPSPSMSYLPPYSPPMHDTQVFSSPYQQPLPSSFGMPMEYSGSYAHPGDYSIPPTSDPHMIYRMPTAMKTEGNTSTGSSTGPGAQESNSHVRVVQGRPKPRCWEHGCNGRQFSTFSNLLRHQREKSGQAAKATCPNCGAEFTRTTARNGHLLHDKCKQRRHT